MSITDWMLDIENPYPEGTMLHDHWKVGAALRNLRDVVISEFRRGLHVLVGWFD